MGDQAPGLSLKKSLENPRIGLAVEPVLPPATKALRRVVSLESSEEAPKIWFAELVALGRVQLGFVAATGSA